MDLNSTTPVAPPMQAGVSARWLWVAVAALATCMLALAGAWMMMPGFGAAHAASASGSSDKEAVRRSVTGTTTSPAAVAQGIQAPEQMSGLGISPLGGAAKLSVR